jgi:hypothetical protein
MQTPRGSAQGGLAAFLQQLLQLLLELLRFPSMLQNADLAAAIAGDSLRASGVVWTLDRKDLN